MAYRFTFAYSTMEPCCNVFLEHSYLAVYYISEHRYAQISQRGSIRLHISFQNQNMLKLQDESTKY